MRVFNARDAAAKAELAKTRKHFSPGMPEPMKAWGSSGHLGSAHSSRVGSAGSTRTRYVVATYTGDLPPLGTQRSRPNTATSNRGVPQGHSAQRPASLPQAVSQSHFGEEMSALRKRNVKLRNIAAQEQNNAVVAETRLAALERELQALTGSMDTDKELLMDVELEKRVQAREKPASSLPTPQAVLPHTAPGCPSPPVVTSACRVACIVTRMPPSRRRRPIGRCCAVLRPHDGRRCL